MTEKDTHQNPDWTEEELLQMDTMSSTDIVEVKRKPIEKFIQRKRRYGREEGYIGKIESALREYEAFLYHQYNEHICNVTDEHVVAFNEYLKSDGKYYVIKKRGPRGQAGETKKRDIEGTTRHDYLIQLVGLYEWLVNDEQILSTNPAKKALTDLGDDEFDLTPPGRPRIEIHEMSEFLKWLPDPQARAIVLFLLKTAARVGEAMNVDLCCLNIDHPLYQTFLQNNQIELVNQVKDKPDTVFFMPSFVKGSVIRGEERHWGNKRKRKNGSVVPIDEELKTSLLEYFLVRRKARKHSTPGKPLFTKTTTRGKGNRMTIGSVSSLLTSQRKTSGYLAKYGWYEQGAPTEENVTLHYFRHYFTHNHKHLRGVYQEHLPKGTRKYIRGDVPDKDDVEDDNYSHSDWDNWGRFIKIPYLDNIYKFGIYD